MTNYQREVLCNTVKELVFIPAKSKPHRFDNAYYFKYKRGSRYLTIYEDNKLEWRGEYGRYSEERPVPKNLRLQIEEILDTDYSQEIEAQVEGLEDEIKEWERIEFSSKYNSIKKVAKQEIEKTKERIVEIQA